MIDNATMESRNEDLMVLQLQVKSSVAIHDRQSPTTPPHDLACAEACLPLENDTSALCERAPDRNSLKVYVL